MIRVDESTLNRTERLGLAYCRLNNGEWDEILGPKPAGFDDLPRFPQKPKWPWQKKGPSKADFTLPAMKAIRSIIGEANASKYWWIFGLEMTEEEWFHWYITP